MCVCVCVCVRLCYLCVRVRLWCKCVSVRVPACAQMGARLLEVDGGGEPGYDHSFARIPVGGEYDPAVKAVVAVYVLAVAVLYTRTPIRTTPPTLPHTCSIDSLIH
jgi:hypothetical protein